MIILADYIRDFERDRFRREYEFVLGRSGPNALCVAPSNQGCDGNYDTTVLYEDGLFYDKSLFPALMNWKIAGQRLSLHTSLSDGMFYAVALADEPSLSTPLEIIGVGETDDAVLAALGLNPEKYCRSHVAAWAEGWFLAPHDGGYAFFYVDTYGPMHIISWSEHLAPVALHLAASIVAEASRLSSRTSQVASP